MGEADHICMACRIGIYRFLLTTGESMFNLTIPERRTVLKIKDLIVEDNGTPLLAFRKYFNNSDKLPARI